MGDIASSHSATQNTTNQQVGVNGAGASGASGSLRKGAIQTLNGGISLSFNTGNNKISASSKKISGGGSKGKNKNKTRVADVAASPVAAPGSIADNSNSAQTDTASNQAGGNIGVTIAQTDQGSVAAGENVSLAALQLAQSANDALLQSNTNAVTLAATALQTGADVASVAIPTYAASEIVDRPVDLAGIQASTDQAAIAANAPQSNTGLIVAVIATVGALALLTKNNLWMTQP